MFNIGGIIEMWTSEMLNHRPHFEFSKGSPDDWNDRVQENTCVGWNMLKIEMLSRYGQ